MKDQTLLRIALAVALIGLCCLYFLAQEIEIDMIPVDQITDEYIGSRVAISGEIISVREFDSMLLFDVRGVNSVGSILVVVFDPVVIAVGDTILVHGQVKDYNGELEIVAERIEVID